MKFIFIGLFFLITSLTTVYANSASDVSQNDTLEVINLNKDAYKRRLSDAEQTVAKATKALNLAISLKYINGIAESYRVIGIGKGYKNQPEKAIEAYLNSLNYFELAHNSTGRARVYNNIGNLYRDIDSDISLSYFKKALPIALKLGDQELLASIYLNIGSVYYRKQSYYEALQLFQKSQLMFEKMNNVPLNITCLQNIGVIYFNIHQYDKAQTLLIEANKKAKDQEMNTTVASIDLTLSSLFIVQNKFNEAENYIQEGLSYAQNRKVESDYKYTYYQLELKRQNYPRALSYLQDIYRKDSLDFKNYVSARIHLLEIKHDQEKKYQENQITIARQEGERIFFWGVLSVACLLLVVIGLLFSNVKRKTATNKKLTELNDEISKQKDDLDRINHHLEDIIDERTKDLLIKNKKLSEYSSYLSHQIRGPIATLKGLMNLEKEGLVGKQECINMMDKCVSEIDEKIIDMSDMLHDPERTTFKGF